MTEKKLGETYAEFAERHKLKHGDEVVDFRGNTWCFYVDGSLSGFGCSPYGNKLFIAITNSEVGGSLPHSFVEPVAKRKLTKVILREFYSACKHETYWFSENEHWSGKTFCKVCDENGVQNTRTVWVKE
jgi:hypothetical protein